MSKYSVIHKRKTTYHEQLEYLALVNWAWSGENDTPHGLLFRCADVIITIIETKTSIKTVACHDPDFQPYLCLVDIDTGSRRRLDFEAEQTSCWRSIFQCPKNNVSYQYALKLVLPSSSGYIVREDLLERRMIDSQFSKRIVSFVRARQYVEPLAPDNKSKSFLAVMASSIGAVFLPDSACISLNSSLKALERDLINRFSISFITRQPIARKVLALVDGRRPLTVSAAGEGVFRAAKGLGVGLVVVDKPGHWLQDSKSAHLRDAFIPVDMTIDSGLSRRIAQGIREYGRQIDGIVTFSDRFLVPTSEAASALNLPTSAAVAYTACTNKFETRKLDAQDCQFFQISTMEELQRMTSNQSKPLHYPMIVKPCSGTSSEGVFKANNAMELQLVTERIFGSPIISSKYGLSVVLESYVDGPEVDVNFVLLDGEILFCEISDDFPSPADLRTAGPTSSFVDVANLLPSSLPENELDLLRSSMHQILLSLGFRNGVFHVEARVRHSAMQYTEVDGVFDLHLRSAESKPRAFLIEVNARMPGNQESAAVERTYGIDYYSIYMLSMLRDIDRLRSMAQPFQDGPQYWCQVLRFHADRGGIWNSGDACEELISRCPQVRGCISHHRCLFRKGQEVPAPLANVIVFTAFFLITSRTSRSHLLSVAQVVRDNFRYEVLEPIARQSVSTIRDVEPSDGSNASVSYASLPHSTAVPLQLNAIDTI